MMAGVGDGSAGAHWSGRLQASTAVCAGTPAAGLLAAAAHHECITPLLSSKKICVDLVLLVPVQVLVEVVCPSDVDDLFDVVLLELLLHAIQVTRNDEVDDVVVQRQLAG